MIKQGNNNKGVSMKQFIKSINSKRKQGGWYTYVGVVEGKNVSLKGYNTWLQVYNVNGVNCGGNMEVSVKEFNNTLAQGLA